MAKNIHVPHDQLVADIAVGAIDTVLAVFGDHAGRLVGKRTDGDVLPRRRARGRHRELRLPDRLRPRQQPDPRLPVGELRPGLRRHARRRRRGDACATCPGSTARRWCWSTSSTSTRAPRSRCRRGASCRPRSSKAAAARLRADARLGDRVLPVQGGRTTRPTQLGYRDLTPNSPYVEDYHILQTTKEEDVLGAIRRGLAGAGMPVEFSKGEAGRGQHELNLTYTTAVEMADINLAVQERRQGDRPLVRQVGDVHGQAVLRRRRVELPHPLQPVVADDGLMPSDGRDASITIRTT